MADTRFPSGSVDAPGFKVGGVPVAGMLVTQARRSRITSPAAADSVSVVAAVALANGALTIVAQPDFPRKLRVAVVDANASITAGIVTLVGKDQDGNTVTETVSMVTAGVKVTTKAYAHLTSATVSAIAGAGGSDTVSVGLDVALGLETAASQPLTTFAVFKADVDSVDEAVGTVDATARTIAPTTAANGTHSFDFWYTFS